MGREWEKSRHRAADADEVQYHSSENITRWLSQEEQRQERREHERCTRYGISPAEERLEPRWVLEFDAKAPGAEPMTHMEECWTLCRRMRQVGLFITHLACDNNSRLMITVGANAHLLRQEAAHVKLPMRMQDTMGMVRFTERPAEHALKQLIVRTLKERRVDDAEIAEIQAGCETLGSIDLASKAKELGCAHIDIQAGLRGGNLYVNTPSGSLFNSTQEQQLVMSLMNKGLLVALEARRKLPDREQAIRQLGSNLKASQPVSAKLLAHMLITFGAYVVDARGRYVRAERIGKACAKVVRVTQIDRDSEGRGPWFIVKDPAVQESTGWSEFEESLATSFGFGVGRSRIQQEKDLERLQTLRLETRGRLDGVEYQPVQWEDLIQLHSELKLWAEGKGKEERFSHTLLSFYPTHDYTELKFFHSRWATLKVLDLDLRLRMRDNENASTEGALYNPNSVVNFNPARAPKQWMLWFQPVDEIRDYFGDEVGIYFAWLGVYTRSLAFSSIFGFLSMLYGVIATGSADPDRNDLTLLYSVFVAVWSVIFLQSWTRRENELIFLWGTEGLAESQEARVEFRGRPQVVGFPGKESWVHHGIIKPKLQMCASWTLIILMMVATVVMGLVAEGLSSNKREWWEKFDRELGNNNGYIDQQELQQIGEALQDKHPSFLEAGQTEASWAEELYNSWTMHDNHTSLPICSTMHRQCTRSDVPEEDTCDEWVRLGYCVIKFNATQGVPIKPASRPTEVNFEAAWSASGYNGYRVYAKPIIPWLKENIWTIAAAFFNLLFLQLFAYFFKTLARVLNDWENHRLQSEYDRHLIVKLYAFAFVNNYFVLFYIAYFRHMEILPEISLPSLLGGKTYGMKIAELGVPLAESLFKRIMSRSKDDDESPSAPTTLGAVTASQKAIERDAHKAEWKGVNHEYAQMVTQFGYLALFAPACSLAPLLAFINNVTEIRSDAWKICNLFRRPTAKPVPSIGAWEQVLKTLALAAVVVNSTMVFFVGSQMACPHDDSDLELKLSGSPVELLSDEDFSDRPTFAERELGGLLCSTWSVPSSSARRTGEGDPQEIDGVSYRVTVSRLWVLALLLEHFVLLLRFAMESFLPTVPTWLETAKETLHFKRAVIEGGINSLEQESIESALKTLRRMGADSAEEVFDEMDLDKDGLLSPQEIERCCLSMGMIIEDKEELMEMMDTMDKDGDNLVTKDEFTSWWSASGGKNKFQQKNCRQVFANHDDTGDGALGADKIMIVCRELGMQMSDKQKELLVKELDADGDNTVDSEEFEMWWIDNGGAKYRPRAPPGPGDMSRKMRFEMLKFENEKSVATTASNAVAVRPDRLHQLDDLGGDTLPDDDNNAPPIPAPRPPIASGVSMGSRFRPQQQLNSGATFEIEQVSRSRQQEHADDDMMKSVVHLNPLNEQQQSLHKQAAPLPQALRTDQQRHTLFSGPNGNASHITRRAAAMLKPPPRPSHVQMTRPQQVQKAHNEAASDRRVERLLMGRGAEISHDIYPPSGTSGVPPLRPPQPSATRAGVRTAAVGHPRDGGGTEANLVATPMRRRPPPVASLQRPTSMNDI